MNTIKNAFETDVWINEGGSCMDNDDNRVDDVDSFIELLYHDCHQHHSNKCYIEIRLKCD